MKVDQVEFEDRILESPDNELSGDLTFGKWVKWHKRATNFRKREHLLSDWEGVSNSRIFVENFLQLPEAMQSRIAVQIMSHVNVTDIAAIIGLQLKLHEITPILSDRTGRPMKSWTQDTPAQIMHTIKEQHDYPKNRKFEDAVEAFLDANQTPKGQAMVTWDSIMELSAYLLTARYDYERVIEVMKAWGMNSIPHSVTEFIYLVENWEKLKAFPVEWSLKLMIEDENEH